MRKNSTFTSGCKQEDMEYVHSVGCDPKVFVLRSEEEKHQFSVNKCSSINFRY